MKNKMVSHRGVRWNALTFILTVLILWLAPQRLWAATGNIYMFTANPELERGTKGIGGFLRSLGYTVTLDECGNVSYRELDTDPDAATKIAQLQTYDLIIIHRNFGSAILNSSAAETSLWNRMKVPILCMNGPVILNDITPPYSTPTKLRWKWIDVHGNANAPQVAPYIVLASSNNAASHPIVADLDVADFNGDGNSDINLFVKNQFFGGDTPVPPPYGPDEGTIDGGTNMVLIGKPDTFGVVADAVCLAVWDANNTNNAPKGFFSTTPPPLFTGEVYYRRRVYFEGGEYRNQSDAAVNDPIQYLSANGKLVYANVVEYALKGTVTPKAPPHVQNLTPANKASNQPAAGGLSFHVTSGQPISDSGVTVLLNGVNVTSSLSFSGTTTDRLVSYHGLAPNLLYNVEIRIANPLGTPFDPRVVQSQFDTFVSGQTTTLSTGDGVNFSGTVPAGNYLVSLQVAATSSQLLTFHRGSDANSGLRGIFNVPNTGGLDTPNDCLVPLTDALGTPILLRTSGGSENFLLDPVDLNSVTPNALVFVPASGVPATLPPVLATASPGPNAVIVSPLTSIDLAIVNGDSAVVPGSINLKLAGIDVTTSSTINSTIDGPTVHYQPPVFLAPGSNYTALVKFSDSAGNTVTNQYSFLIRSMPAIPAAYATPVGSGINRGFNLRNHMALSQAGVPFCSTAARVELQLAGQYLNPGGQPVTNAINNTPYAQPFTNITTINYGSTNDGSQGWFAGDQLLPGSNIVGPTNVAFEATAYLELKAGINRYGVKSSDGFQLTAGPALDRASQGVLLGEFDASRGDQNPTEGPFLVYQDGLYAFRLLYHKGGDPNVSLEWYSRTNDVEFVNDFINVGDRTLINDVDVNGDTPTPAYRQRTVDPARPILNIVRSGNEVIITWNASADFLLQSKPALTSASWTTASQPQTVNGTLHTVHIPLAAQRTFYRLQSP